VPVPAIRGGGEACDVPTLHLCEDPFEGNCREVMAFIHNNVTVPSHEVVHVALADQALDHGDIEPARRQILPSPDPADGFWINSQERGKPRDPLVEDRLPVDKDKGIAPARGREERADHRFPGAGRGDEESIVVGQENLHRFFLHSGQAALESKLDRFSFVPLVLDRQRDVVSGE